MQRSLDDIRPRENVISADPEYGLVTGGKDTGYMATTMVANANDLYCKMGAALQNFRRDILFGLEGGGEGHSPIYPIFEMVRKVLVERC